MVTKMILKAGQKILSEGRVAKILTVETVYYVQLVDEPNHFAFVYDGVKNMTGTPHPIVVPIPDGATPQQIRALIHILHETQT